MDWKKIHRDRKKHGGLGQTWRSCWWVLWHWGYCASWILSSGANSKLLVLSPSPEKSKRKCQEEKSSVVKQLLVPPSWQCASLCIVTDSLIFCQHEHNCTSSAILFTWLGSRRIFLISQTEIHL
jgi:hypothetical protein